MRKMTHVFAAMTAAVLLAVPNACCVFAAKETVGSAPQVELGVSDEGAITEAETDGLVPVLEIHLPEESEEQATSDALEEGGVTLVRAESRGTGDPVIRQGSGEQGSRLSAGKAGETDWSQISALRREVVDYARRFEGSRYTFGGISPETGFDCSGFVQYVMRQSAGLRLTHQSAAQAQTGEAVTVEAMRPGDLVAYDGTPRDGAVNHISIYIGDGKAIHAAGTGKGVQITAWDYAAPLMIRNVLGD